MERLTAMMLEDNQFLQVLAGLVGRLANAAVDKRMKIELDQMDAYRDALYNSGATPTESRPNETKVKNEV